MLFLQILGGIALFVLVLILVAGFWVRNKLRAMVDEASKLGGYTVPLEGRIRLAAFIGEVEEWFDPEPLKAFQAWQVKLQDAGFVPVGEFQEENSDALYWIAHRENRYFAVLTEASGQLLVSYCGEGLSGRRSLVTAHPFYPTINRETLLVQPGSQMEPAQGMQWLVDQGKFKKLSTHQLLRLLEQVHAACMDLILVNPDCREMLAKWTGFAALEPLTGEDLEHSIESCEESCDEAIELAIRDHARVASGLDDDGWSRIEDELLVINRDTSLDDLVEWFDTPLTEEFINQLQPRNLSTTKVFEAVNRRLGKKEQFALLAEVSQPVPAQVHARRIQLESIGRAADALKPGAGLKRFLYQALDEEDQPISSAFVAASVADARALLQRAGYSDIKILSSNQDPVPAPEVDMEEMAASLIKAQSDSMPQVLIKIILGNGILWVPFALWAGWSLLEGEPYTTSDQIAFLLASLSFGWTLYLTLPSFLYNASQEALAWGRPDRARRYFQWLRKLGAPGIQKTTLEGEEAKILAYGGDKGAALDHLDTHRAGMQRPEYLAFLGQVHDAARDYPKMIEVHRQLMEEFPDNQEHRVELAMSLLRYTDRCKEAADLLGEVHPNDCSHLYAHGFTYAQGLAAGCQGNHQLAVSKLHQAFDGFSEFRSPIVSAVQAEIAGYMAAHLHRCRDHDQAKRLWDQVRPRMEALKAEHVLRVYRAAAPHV
jgi:hypothetical protein